MKCHTIGPPRKYVARSPRFDRNAIAFGSNSFLSDCRFKDFSRHGCRGGLPRSLGDSIRMLRPEAYRVHRVRLLNPFRANPAAAEEIRRDIAALRGDGAP